MLRRGAVVLAGLGVVLIAEGLHAGDWPQFRGPASAGLAVGEQSLPADIAPERHVAWKTMLPPGHSSPAIFGDRIYLTAVRDGQLLTLALDRGTGRRLWEATAPHEKLEEIHRIGSHAQSSPAADDRHVVSLFGSCGLFCHDREGARLWHIPMGPFKNDFGAGSSPLIVDGRVILCQDHDTDSFLAAYDVETGREIWKVDRSEFPRNYASPVIWNVEGKRQIVCAATLRVVGYDFDTGIELWTVRGIARFISATPVVGGDGRLYVTGWANGGDAGGERISFPPFDEHLAEFDKNQNGVFEEDELPEGPVKMRFSQVDRDKSGTITEAEYKYFQSLFDQGKNVTLAIRPGGRGECTETHVDWTYDRNVPFCASPIYVGSRLFTFKDGGILTCLDVKSGKPLKQGRVSAAGAYYSSPVSGDGKIYLLNEEGKLTVLSADDRCEELASADFGENVYATPAIVDGRIYLRTVSALYCFEK